MRAPFEAPGDPHPLPAYRKRQLERATLFKLRPGGARGASEVARGVIACVIVVCAVLCGPQTVAARTPPLSVPETRPFQAVDPTTGPFTKSNEPIDAKTLAKMFRVELGALYQPALDLQNIHALIEKYFDPAASAGERKDAAARLATSGVDAAIIGRLCRIRANWAELPGGAIFYVNEKHGPYTVRYFCGVPQHYDRTKSWPLVVKLPTANAFLTDPPPDADRVVAIYTDWIKAELTTHPDVAIIMPLLNLTELWGPSYDGMNNAVQPMLDVCDRLNIDPARVYLIGHSEAAHATWNIALHEPTYFAAINPLAGAASADWQRLRLMNLRNVLPVVWADDDDVVVKPESSKSIVKALRGLKIDVDFTETHNIGHAPSEAVADACYDKCLARVRDLYPSQETLQSNRPDPIFNRADWLQVWQAMTPGTERRLYLHRGTGYLTVSPNPMSVDAKITGNRIDVKTDNVESFTLGINDRMLDRTKPVKVVVNGRTRFDKICTPMVERMLNDQLFLGRGWRYFTTLIDIDLLPPPTTRPTTGPASSPSTRPSNAPADSAPRSGTGPTSRHAAPHGGTITVGPSKNE